MLLQKRYTDHSERSLDLYFNELKNIDILSPEREKELFELFQNPDTSNEKKDRIIQEILSGHQRFVVSVAKQFQKKEHLLTLNDLINEGILGLEKAIHNYKIDMGVKFLSYAVWNVRQYIINAINHTNPITIPKNHYQNTKKIYKVRQKLLQVLHRDPTPTEIADELLDISREAIEEILSHQKLANPVSLSLEVSNEKSASKTPLEDLIPNTENSTDTELIQKDLQSAIRTIIDTEIKKPQDKRILSQAFGFDGEPLSYKEIAVLENISPERIRQRVNQCLRVLKPHMTFDGKF